MQRVLMISIFGSLLTGCTPYRMALLNNTGAPAEVTVRRHDGIEMTGRIPDGRRLMMEDRIVDLDSVRYVVHGQACSLTREEMASRASSEAKIDVVGLSPCIGAE